MFKIKRIICFIIIGKNNLLPVTVNRNYSLTIYQKIIVYKQQSKPINQKKECKKRRQGDKEQHNIMKNKKIWERMIPISQADDDFELKFWQRAGVQMRFAAAWQMIKDFYKIRGKNEIKPRLQRSIQNIQQI